MRLFRPGFIAGFLFPEAIFRIKTSEKVLCLTFDDGPNPGSTLRILDILGNHNVKATFFCNGSAAEKYPELISLIISGGHIIGNHGYHHLDGWRTSIKRYIENTVRASPFTSSGLFRPPYGRLSLTQYRKLVKTFKIVFWDTMPYDFDRRFGSENSLIILKKKIRPGSVIALHDKTSSTVESFLGEFIEYATSEGYKFVIPLLSGQE